MKNYLLCIFAFIVSLEVSAGIFLNLLSLEWQYVLSLSALACGGILSVTSMNRGGDRIMQLLFLCVITLGILNLLNILLIHNWAEKISLMNFSVALIATVYYYIGRYVLLRE